MANIERRQSKDGILSFRVKVRLRGHRPVSETFRRLTDARHWAQSTEAAIRERRYFKTSESTRHTLAEMVDRFCDTELPKLPKVARLMRAQLGWWRSHLGHLVLADVAPSEISAARDRLLHGGSGSASSIKPATVNRYLAALSIAFSAASKEWGWLEENPVRKVKKLREPRGRVRYLDDDERKRLLAACRESSNPFIYMLVVLALSTGVRKSELLTLRWPAVDLKRGHITLHETKNDERRSVPLTGHALELLRAHGRVRRLKSDLLFPSARNPAKPIAIQDPWTKSLLKAGISDFRFHDLRHSAASYLAMNGASLVEIASVLGHKTLQMVKRYAHLSEQHTAQVVGAMNKSIFG